LRTLHALPVLGMLLFTSNMVRAEKVALIGLGLDGKEQVQMMDESVIAKNWSATLAPSLDGVIESADELEVGQKRMAKWMLDTIEVGLELSASVGLGSVVQASVAPRYYAILKKQKRGTK